VESLSTTSNIVSFNCDTVGVAENLFWIGSDPSRGKYRMITTVLDKYEQEYNAALNETTYIENVESFEEDY
jgi:hypothetical protein